MPINYLCIDDEPEDEINIFLNSLSEQVEELGFSFANPEEFEDTIKSIKDAFPDGLLLDLRLDDRANANGKKARYKAMSLAQELRTKMTEDRSFTFPIALWSIDSKFKKSYNRDKTAHDIFDAVYHKSDARDRSKEFSEELVNLAKGYKFISAQISQGKVFHKILGLSSDEELKALDPRIGGNLTEIKHYPNHIYARFLLHTFLKYPGPVIDEFLLAARLGIDIGSSNDWSELLDKKLKNTKYKGAFCDLKPRWWMHAIDKWWNEISSGNTALRSLSASERVDLIKKKTKLKNLTPATPITEGYSDKFWTVCHVSNKAPLSPHDGVKIISDTEDWQEPEYVSLKARLERIEHKSYSIDPLEIPRIKRYAEMNKNADTRN